MADDQVLIFGGERNVCRADGDLDSWARISLPTTSSLDPFRTTFVEFGFGFMAAAPRDCFDTPAGCPPYVEQFGSVDGVTWSAFDGPTADLAQAYQLTFAQGGPDGDAIGLASFATAEGRRIAIYELVEGP
jgi:hypothetical protein